MKQRRMSPEAIVRLQGQIEDRLAHLPRGRIFRKGEVLELAEEHGATGLTANKLDYLVQSGLIRPAREQHDSRILYGYSRDDIRDVILVQMLREGSHTAGGKKPTLARITNLLRDSAALRRHDSSRREVARPDVGVPTQIERGYVYFRSRILGVCLNWLFRGRLPIGGIVVTRRRIFDFQQAETDFARVDYKQCDSLAIDHQIGNLRPNDLYAEVSEEGEVLLGVPRPSNLLRFQKWQWHHLKVDYGSPRRLLEFAIGVVPFSGAGEGIGLPLDSEDGLLLAMMLEACFLEVDPESLTQNEQALLTTEDYCTPLAVIAEIVPDLSQKWQYCAVLKPDVRQTGRLRFVAMSSHFPVALQRDASIEPGRLLSGWAYKYGHMVLVQHSLGPLDPRLSYQDEEKAVAAIAVPTIARGQTNGVLYVGTRQAPDDHKKVFSLASIRLLRIVANILGEIIERNLVRADAERFSLNILSEPPLTQRPWTDLKMELLAALDSFERQGIEFASHDNLHIVAVSIDNYDEFLDRSSDMAQWLADHIREVTYRFYLSSGLGVPKLFNRSDDFLAQFACLLAHITRTDDEDRQWRTELRSLLNSITVQFDIHSLMPTCCFVWSMPFQIDGLLREIRQEGLDATVARLVREAEDALVVLPFIERGHDYERRNAFPRALEEYLQAHVWIPENVYIMRHIAKMFAAIGDYDTAIEWWNRVLSYTVHPSHVRRLGQVLACEGEFEAAAKAFSEATRLAPTNPSCYLEWGDVLLTLHHERQAIEKYERALLYDDQNAVKYWLRIADAHRRLGDPRQAKSYVRLVLTREPDRWESIRALLDILDAESGTGPRGG